MLKLKMYALYDHFPDHNPIEGEPYISCYSDSHVMECTHPGKNIALMLEPRSMIGEYCDYVYDHHNYFEYIFTHDGKLLTLPNAKLLMWNEVWHTADVPKTKGISLVTSYKNWCPLHIARIELAEELKDKGAVDVYYGDWNNPAIPNVEPQTYLDEYKFSIVIENDIDDYWYTEKILNCFATKTVPIYVGSKIIDTIFNGDGIIQIDDWRTIPELVNNMDPAAEYVKRLEAINDNYGRLDPYRVGWKDRFFRDYSDILEELQNG